MSAAGIHLLCGLCSLCASARNKGVSRRGAEEAETAEGVVL
jgi:hypothetical protein